jgi:hypothetical protein
MKHLTIAMYFRCAKIENYISILKEVKKKMTQFIFDEIDCAEKWIEIKKEDPSV